jgi:hypothetical protein
VIGRLGIVGLAAVAMFTGAGRAEIPADLTRLHWYGTIAYQTGGPDPGRGRMKDLALRYPLSIQFVESDGSRFPPGAQRQVTIEDVFGNPIFSAEAKGPFMLIDLPEGTYRVKVSVEGVERRRDVVIRHLSHRRLVFWWAAEDIETQATISAFEDIGVSVPQ